MAMTEREFIDLTKSVMKLAQQKASLQGENNVLREQLEQRDKTVADLRSDIARHSESTVLIAKDAGVLRERNKTMLSVLKRLLEMDEIELLECSPLIRDTIAQVSTASKEVHCVTVSNQGGDTQ